MLSNRLRQLPYVVHTNRELGLMLRGSKPLAYFSEFIGHEPDICIRYWRMFDRHVDQGRIIKREVMDVAPDRPQLTLRRLLYALPGHEWRIDAMLALLDEAGWCDDKEYRFGALLGYEAWQNDYWLKHRASRSDAT
ncbi:MAG TPA: hypothetical protein VGM57_03850 [Pseudolabrys sp.]|jgi:hypothetical protein